MATSAVAVVERDIADIHRALRAGSVSVRDLTAAYLARIQAYDQQGPALNAVVCTDAEALAKADALDKAHAASGVLSGPLHGIAILVKDNVDVAGLPSSSGVAAFRDYLPPADAHCIARLRAAGALLLGKTTMPDFASSWWAYSSLSGETRNPYDLARDPGGSSAGSGAATAASFATAAIGTDCGGSIRLPAACNGLVGVRGTPGLVSRSGSGALVALQDTVGPMTRSVEDAARLLEVMVGYDPQDEVSAQSWAARTPPSYVAALDRDGLRGARIGLLLDALGSDGDEHAAPVNASVRASCDAIRKAGATLTEVRLPDLQRHIVDTSMYVNCSRHAINSYLITRPELPLRSLQQVIDQRAYHPMLDLLEACAFGPELPEYDPQYFRRLAAREQFARAVMNVMAAARLDALVFPTVQVLPPTRAQLASKVWTTLTFPTNTLIASQTWLPSITVPAGMSAQHLPVGLEFLVRPYDEAGMLRMAYAFEQATRARRAPQTTPEL
ncbi:MAG: amidase [Gammaproteobacteria bacterium]|nr:amidase [Gammaproteobacteria bacterium]